MLSSKFPIRRPSALRHAIIAITVPAFAFLALACGDWFPHDDRCSTYSTGGLPRDTLKTSCEGNVVVQQAESCDPSTGLYAPSAPPFRQDCAATGEVCRDAQCVVLCNVDGDCGANRYCAPDSNGNKRCLDARTAGDACTSNAQCASGLACLPNTDAATAEAAAPDAGQDGAANDASTPPDASAVDGGDAQAPLVDSNCRPR